jgi:hypothetical protein
LISPNYLVCILVAPWMLLTRCSFSLIQEQILKVSLVVFLAQLLRLAFLSVLAQLLVLALVSLLSLNCVGSSMLSEILDLIHL